MPVPSGRSLCVHTDVPYMYVQSVYCIPYRMQANYLLLGAGEEAMDFLGKFMIFRIF